MNNCEVSICKHYPVAICLHCQQYLCVEHLLEHNEQMIRQADIYCDKFNQLTEQIENLSIEDKFQSAQQDLDDWLHNQIKILNKIYEEKLHELKQKQIEIRETCDQFKENQRMKIDDFRRLFNSKSTKQISLEQLNQMKTTIEQFENDIFRFENEQCSIKLTNHNNQSKLNADAKPFEYASKSRGWNLIN